MTQTPATHTHATSPFPSALPTAESETLLTRLSVSPFRVLADPRALITADRRLEVILTLASRNGQLHEYRVYSHQDGATIEVDGHAFNPLADREQHLLMIRRTAFTRKVLLKAADAARVEVRRDYSLRNTPAQRAPYEIMDAIVHAVFPPEFACEVPRSNAQANKRMHIGEDLASFLACPEGRLHVAAELTIKAAYRAIEGSSQTAFRRRKQAEALAADPLGTLYTPERRSYSTDVTYSIQYERWSPQRRHLIDAHWPELCLMRNQEAYLRAGQLLTAKLRAYRTKGFGKTLTALANTELPGGTSHTRITTGIRTALRIFPRETLARIYEECSDAGNVGLIEVALLGEFPNQPKGQTLSAYADAYLALQRLSKELELRHASSVLSPKKLSAAGGDLMRCFTPANNSGETNMRSLEYFCDKMANAIRKARVYPALFKQRCQELGVPSDDLNATLCAPTPDHWGRTVTVDGRRFHIHAAATTEDIEREGDFMRSCVGNGAYHAGAISGEQPLLMGRLRGHDFTVKLNASTLEATEFKGKLNASPTELQRSAFKEWQRAVRANEPSDAPHLSSAARTRHHTGNTDMQRQQAHIQFELEQAITASMSAEDAAYTRTLRRTVQEIMSRIDKAATNALTLNASLLGPNVGICYGPFTSSNVTNVRKVLVLNETVIGGSAALMDTPYGPFIRLTVNGQTLVNRNGSFRWQRQSGHVSIFSHPTRKLEDKESGYTYAFRIRSGESRTYLEEILQTGFLGCCVQHVDAAEFQLLRPSELPKCPEARQALKDHWAALKAKRGLSVNASGVLTLGGHMLKMTHRQAARAATSDTSLMDVLRGADMHLMAGWSRLTPSQPEGVELQAPLSAQNLKRA